MAGDNEEKKTSRFSAQAFLLEFYKYTVGDPTTSWDNFSKINSDPAIAVNDLMNRRAGFKLNELTPAQLSLLVPKFRLEKVKTTQGKIETIGEFRFDDTTLGIEDITRGIGTTKKGKPDIVGLESFTWDDLGNNPANTGVAFKATMQLVLSNMNALFSEKGRDKDGNPIFFKDLLGLETGIKKGVNPEYDPQRTRIRATVGWTLGKTAAKQIAKLGGDANNLTAEQIQKAVDASTVSFFLNLIKHDFDINENGMIKMSIDYIASIESLMSLPSADIFYDPQSSQIIKEKQRQLGLRRTALEIADSDLDKANAELKLSDSRRGGNLNPDPPGFKEAEKRVEEAEAVKDLNDESVKRIEKEIDSLKSQRLLKIYSSITQELFLSGGIRFLELTQAQRKLYNELEVLSQSGMDGKMIQRRRTDLLKKAKLVLGDNIEPKVYEKDKTPGRTQLSALERAANPKSRSSSKEQVKLFTEGYDKLQIESGQRKKPNDQRINFFYLGDLLNIAIGRANKNIDLTNAEPKFNFLVGKMDFSSVNENDVEEKSAINLADIPISLDYFLQWFKDNVITPLRPKYILRNFVRDVVSKLVLSSLNTDSLKKGIITPINRVNVQNVCLPGKFPLATNSIYSSEDIIDLVKWNNVRRGDYTDYFFIYCSGFSGMKMRGNIKEDEDKGILHIIMGADRGILKNTNLSRQDLPGQTEVNIEKAEGSGQKGSTLYSDKYNAELTLVGNTLFKPGMMFFLETKALGIGSPGDANSLASNMGIGGYYRVLNVDCVIESGKFETRVKGNLETLNKGRGDPKIDTTKTIADPSSRQSREPVGTGIDGKPIY